MDVDFQSLIKAHKLSQKLNAIFIVYPYLLTPCERLVGFIGSDFMLSERPLVIDMLDCALKTYKDAGDAASDATFLDGLFVLAIGLYQRRFIARRKSVISVWDPMIDSVTAFQRQHVEAKFEMVDEAVPQVVSELTASLYLASRVVQGDVFTEYFEKSIVKKREGGNEKNTLEAGAIHRAEAVPSAA